MCLCTRLLAFRHCRPRFLSCLTSKLRAHHRAPACMALEFALSLAGSSLAMRSHIIEQGCRAAAIWTWSHMPASWLRAEWHVCMRQQFSCATLQVRMPGQGSALSAASRTHSLPLRQPGSNKAPAFGTSLRIHPSALVQLACSWP